jgi:hypothetical protein
LDRFRTSNNCLFPFQFYKIPTSIIDYYSAI